MCDVVPVAQKNEAICHIAFLARHARQHGLDLADEVLTELLAIVLSKPGRQ